MLASSFTDYLKSMHSTIAPQVYCLIQDYTYVCLGNQAYWMLAKDGRDPRHSLEPAQWTCSDQLGKFPFTYSTMLILILLLEIYYPNYLVRFSVSEILISCLCRILLAIYFLSYL